VIVCDYVSVGVSEVCCVSERESDGVGIRVSGWVGVRVSE
jgi:hypothetical protein